MSKYATNQKFGGQRASLGRMVIERTTSAPGAGGVKFLRPCVIEGVKAGGEILITPFTKENHEFGSGVHQAGPFFDTKTEDDLERMPIGSWCWPPRV